MSKGKCAYCEDLNKREAAFVEAEKKRQSKEKKRGK